MTPTFSILHASYGRPEKAVAAMRMWFERAANPGAIEYIFACNHDDPSTLIVGEDRPRQISVKFGDFKGSAPAWDAAAKVSTGQILIQGQDDVEPPEYWDSKLFRLFADYSDAEQHGVVLTDEPTFVAVGDGFRKDRLCCTAIMNRARYEQQGEFLHAGFLSMFSDDDVTYRAYRDQRDGKCVVIEARDLVFLHRHHYHDRSVPMDATYQRENSPEAYRIGGALFAARNPRAATDGIRDWS